MMTSTRNSFDNINKAKNKKLKKVNKKKHNIEGSNNKDSRKDQRDPKGQKNSWRILKGKASKEENVLQN